MRAVPMPGSEAPVVVVGAGIAGLATALRLSPVPVALITGTTLGGECATGLAQGGIAAAVGPDDSWASHAADTEAAAAGLTDGAVAGAVAKAAEDAVAWLVSQGVRIDCDEMGNLALGLEAAHSHPRILHAGGDRTGREIVRALAAAVRTTPSIRVVEHTKVDALTMDHRGAVDGVLLRRGEETGVLGARGVVLATGGIGGLFAHTTNPLSAIGSGLALGARAGAVLRDLEFVQFHPTAIDIGRDPMPLATEALRGAGARLVTFEGDDILAGVPGGALAARDIVASALFARLATGQRTFLELPKALIPEVASRFPGLVATCAEVGIDLTLGRIPVRPAAHYHMGGLKADERGRTTIEGLWACGEVASTGLHGANRLASNSLLEAVVFASAIADDISGISSSRNDQRVALEFRGSDAGVDREPQLLLSSLRGLMDRRVGVVRDEDGLVEMARALGHAAFGTSAIAYVELVALMIAVAARARRETRGSHRRADYPLADHSPRSQEITLSTVRAAVVEVTSGAALRKRSA